MNIFFELGNTRLKAASLSKNGYEFLGAVNKNEVESGVFIDSFQLTHKCSHVYLCSVASAQDTSALIEKIKTHFQIYPTILTTQPVCCDIRCGYTEFDKLGVDRWMSILGACAHSAKPVLIVSAGTALTIDAVLDKQHLGGFIVPGISLMRRSLVANTALINEYDTINDMGQFQLFATDTENAILGGTLYMAASYINAIVKDLELETGRKFECIGTGGDFIHLNSLMDKQFTYVEDLPILGMIKVIESC